MRKTLATVFAIAGSVSTAAYAADRPIKVDDRLDASADALTDMMRAFDRGIPQDLLDKARCVVVVPGMKKAGFIFAADDGRGFEVCRRSGAPRLRCGLKVEALGFRLAPRKPMLCCW